jgi:hypothetical protein
MSTKLSAAILFACLCIVGMLEQQDVELAQKLASERQPAKVARR